MKRKALRFCSGVLITLVIVLNEAAIYSIVVLIFDDSPPTRYNIVSQNDHGLRGVLRDLCVSIKLSASLEKKCFGYKAIIVRLPNAQNGELAFSKPRSQKIYIEQHLFEILTTAEIKALLAHEIGHKLLRTSDEFIVDKFAARLAGSQAMIEVLRKVAKLMNNEGTNKEIATRIQMLAMFNKI